MNKLLLLDIDGVLVRPLGYRAALRASLATIAQWMGFADFSVEEQVISSLEARGISSEFDMLPLLVGALCEAVLSSTPTPELSEDLTQAAEQIAALHPSLPTHWSVAAFTLQEDCFPAEAAYRQGIYPSIPDPLRRSLLLHSRNVYRSTTTRLFQQFVLGSQRFREVYGLPAQVQAPCYLQTYDQPLLEPSSLQRLERAWRSGRIWAAAMTARPSLPPREVSAPDQPYPPEAEAALELLGLADLPLIGLGKVEYVARQANLPVEKLLKPSPAQALAAALVASGSSEINAIQAAVAWLANPTAIHRFNGLPKQFELHVVEDTLGGIRSTRAAAEGLRQLGYRVDLYAWGLTDGNALKRTTLEKEDVRCFDTWEALLDQLDL